MEAGSFIRSTDLLNGTFFENALILITEYNENGAAGFIINRRFERNLNELTEFSNSIPFPLLEGGPVDPEHIYLLHNKPDLIPGGEQVFSDVCVGGDINKALHYINHGSLKEDHIRLFLGYCGWDKNELDAELEEGSWEICNECGDVLG